MGALAVMGTRLKVSHVATEIFREEFFMNKNIFDLLLTICFILIFSVTAIASEEEYDGSITTGFDVELMNAGISPHFTTVRGPIVRRWAEDMWINGQVSLTVAGVLDAMTWVWSENGSTLRVNSIGAETLLFNSWGLILASSGIHFNDTPTSGIGVFVHENRNIHFLQAVYARGIGYTFNHSTFAWDNFQIGRTSDVTIRSGNSSNDVQSRIDQAMIDFEYANAKNGMIGVIGINGVQGYAFAQEIRGEMPSSPEEVASMQATSGNSNRFINVYNTYGAIVDQFPIIGGIIQ